MDDAAESGMLDDVVALLAYLEVDTLEAAGDLISEDIDPDAWFIQEEGELVLRMATAGFVLEFPLAVVDFWEMIHQLEDDVVAIWESESE